MVVDNKQNVIPLPTKVSRNHTYTHLMAAGEYLAAKLNKAAKENYEIILFGDFDVDGTTSSAIFFLFSKLFRLDHVFPFVSKRHEGYGLNERSVGRLISENHDKKNRAIVIAMDMGVSSTKESRRLLESGFDVMIIDHHVPKPDSQKEWKALENEFGSDRVYAYDPLLFKGSDDEYLSCLSAAGLTYKILVHIMENNLHGFGEKTISEDRVSVNLHSPKQSIEAVLGTAVKLCSIAQASDCMPFAIDGQLTEAWEMAKEFEMPSKLLAGIGILYEQTHTASRIPWVIGPIINAAGRLEDAFASYELMTETDELSARTKIDNIKNIRTKVQTLTRYAEENLDTDVLTSKGVVVAMGKTGIIKGGVIGIAAARASEAFSAPALYLCEEDYNGSTVLKGSMRRGETTFSCEKWILELTQNGIIIAGGGHPAAAGLTLSPDNLNRLIESAEKAVFEHTPKPEYEASIGTLVTYGAAVTAVMPYGKGHESAHLKINALLSFVTPLKTKKEGRVWAYALRLSDIEGGENTSVKVMSGDLPENVIKILDKISNRRILSPVEVVVTVHDNFKLGSRFERAEFRVIAEKQVGFTVDSASRELVKKPVVETGSGMLARFKFLSNDEYLKIDNLSGEDGKSDKANTKSNVSISEIVSRSENHGSVEAEVSSKGNPEGLKSTIDILTSEAHTDLLDVDSSIYLEIDYPTGLDPRSFLLKRPTRQIIETALGADGLEELHQLHGGRWDQSKKGYVISFGVMDRLLAKKDSSLKIIITDNAMRHYETIVNSIGQIEVEKTNHSAFSIPFFKESAGLVPFPFQYADVKFFLKRRVALCGNDMGTGKTLESGIWSALRLKGVSEADLNKNDQDNSYKGRPPVLFILLKSVLGQFSGDLERMFDVKQSSFTTGDVSRFLKGDKSKVSRSVGLDGSDDSDDEDIMLDIVHGDRDQKGRKSKKTKQDKNPDKAFKPIKAVSKEDIKKFHEIFIGDSGFVFTTYDTLARNPWIVSSYSWSGVVCDEAHELKGSNTHRTRAIFGQEIDGEPLKGSPVLALSGTFAKNRPADWFVWARLTGADGGLYTGGRLSEARVRFDMRFDGLRFREIRVRGGKEKIISERGLARNGDELKIILYPYIMRRLKTEISAIPPLALYTHRVASTGLYNDVISLMKGNQEINDDSRELLTKYKLMDSKGNLKGEKMYSTEDDLQVIDPNSLMGKLSMISSLDKAYGVIPILRERNWLNPGVDGKIDPIVIMAFHQSAAKEVSEQLERNGIEHFLMMQSDNPESREDKKMRFQNGERSVFVTTYGTGGTGLNLTRAHRLMMINLPWNDTALAQARDRIFRLGQTRPCEVCVILLAGSVDEGVYYMIKNKGRATAKTIGTDQMSAHQVPEWATGGVLDSAVSTSAQKHKSPRRKFGEAKKKKEKETQDYIEAEMGKTGYDI